MPTDTTTPSRVARRFAAARFVVRVGAEWSPIRAARIWPIADVLDVDPAADSRVDAAEEGLLLDLVDSGMIAPPRPRRRRERPVSSRAVFYQAVGT